MQKCLCIFLDSPTCDYDSLVLSDELDRTAQCGGGDGQIPAQVELKGKKVKFSFKTDDSISAAGFHMMYNITRLQQGMKNNNKKLLISILYLAFYLFSVLTAQVQILGHKRVVNRSRYVKWFILDSFDSRNQPPALQCRYFIAKTSQ